MCFYSHLKYHTVLCHFWLGGSHVLAVLGGFVAINPASISTGSMILALAVGCWTVGFDVIYSTLDVEFDRNHRIHSLPVRFGIKRALIIARLLHILSIVLFALTGVFFSMKTLYAVGVLLAGIMLVYEHSLVKADDLSHVNRAFFTVNGIISVTMSTIGVLDILLF